MSELTSFMTTILIIEVIIGIILFFISFWKNDERFAFAGAAFLLTAGTIGLIFYNIAWSEEDLLKLSKEIKNKEIASVEMENPVITYDNDPTDSIEVITYIDADGDKTQINCSDFNLPNAHIKESDDSKYHITIVEDRSITVYIPKSKGYTSK